VIADDRIPGDGTVEPGGLEGLLIVDGGDAELSAGCGDDILAVDHINEPAEFVELGAVGHISEHDPEIEGRLPVQGVHGLDGSVEHLGGRKEDR
jgi:hypothetical protein